MKHLKFLPGALIFVGLSFAEGLTIRLSTGKTRYLAEEPIYFKILLVNDSKNPITYNSPLSIGLGSFTFCEQESNTCVKDKDPFDVALIAPIVGNLAPGHGYRITGTLNHGLQKRLFGSRQGRKRVFVKAELVSDPALKKTKSETIELEIIKDQPEDDSLIKDLNKYATIDFVDNGRESRLFPPNIADVSAKEKALIIMEKHRSSRLFPYTLSYLSDYSPVNSSTESAKKAKGVLVNSLSRGEGFFGGSDPYLRIHHSLRCIKQGRIENSGVSKQDAEACKVFILKSLKGDELNGILKEKGISEEMIEDYDWVKFVRPDIFSSELDHFLTNGTFKTDWKATP